MGLSESAWQKCYLKQLQAPALSGWWGGKEGVRSFHYTDYFVLSPACLQEKLTLPTMTASGHDLGAGVLFILSRDCKKPQSGVRDLNYIFKKLSIWGPLQMWVLVEFLQRNHYHLAMPLELLSCRDGAGRSGTTIASCLKTPNHLRHSTVNGDKSC